MLEHPDVARIEETGNSLAEDYSVLHCETCGCGIREDDPYYDINDTVYCQDCVKEMLRYA